MDNEAGRFSVDMHEFINQKVQQDWIATAVALLAQRVKGAKRLRKELHAVEVERISVAVKIAHATSKLDGVSKGLKESTLFTIRKYEEQDRLNAENAVKLQIQIARTDYAISVMVRTITLMGGQT